MCTFGWWALYTLIDPYNLLPKWLMRVKAQALNIRRIWSVRLLQASANETHDVDANEEIQNKDKDIEAVVHTYEVDLQLKKVYARGARKVSFYNLDFGPCEN